MLVGHYGVAFGAKPAVPAVPLWVYFIAVQWLDVIWSVLVLLGVEKLRIVPGFTEANPYDLYFMPYTHGLLGAIVLSLALGAVVAAFVSRQRGRALLIVSAAAFSHWLLDLIVHTPDLPLYDNSNKVGFGLWRHVAISFPLEIAVLLAGTWYFARRLPPADQRGHWALRIFTVALIALQIYATFGPPPSSQTAMAVMALGLYAVLAALVAALEHIRKAR